MNKLIRSLAVAAVGVLALPAVAAANTASPRSPVTRQLPGIPCSVTANFTLNAGTQTMSYGGGVSCAGAVGQKTIDVVPQVFRVVNGKPLWFNISLIGRYHGPTPINPLRLTATAAYVPSHTYRLLVYGQVMLPSGRSANATACSGECSGDPSLTVAASNRFDAGAAHHGSGPRAPLRGYTGRPGVHAGERELCDPLRSTQRL